MYRFYIFLVTLFCFYTCSLNAQNGTVTIEKDPKIDELIKVKKELNLENVFKIQIFKCESTEESKCKTQKRKFDMLFENTPSEIEWITPTFRVRVGQYRTRLEAEYALQKIKEEFNGAFVL